MNNNIQYKFSGHETFHCRPIWLKKGYDYARTGKLFNDDDAVIELGVGKNMVASIKFWLRAFGFLNPNTSKLEGLSHDILKDDGYDPYLEDDATLYLLHYLLVKNVKTASIYHLAFLRLSKEKLEFTPSNLQALIERECLKEKVDFNQKTLNNDINVFFKNYVPSEEKKGGFEDNYNGLFYDLRLINRSGILDGEKKYRFNINEGKYLPEAIFLYVLLDVFEGETSISLGVIRDKVSSVFLMEQSSTYSMIKRLANSYAKITFKDDGGRQELQIREGINKEDILRGYYAKF